MAHIDLQNDLPGIRGPMLYRPETAKPMNELAEILLRDDNNSLTRGERELIATHVSYLNDCFFCQNVHGALAGHYLQCNREQVDAMKQHGDGEAVSPKMKALLAIAALVQQSGKAVTEAHIATAKQKGATDRELHDTVLIAAAFCMFNRYVDGLGTWAPQDHDFYTNRAPQRAAEGYLDFDPAK